MNKEIQYIGNIRGNKPQGYSGSVYLRGGYKSNSSFERLQGSHTNCNEIGYIDKGTGKHQSNTVYATNGLSPCITAVMYKEPYKVIVYERIL